MRPLKLSAERCRYDGNNYATQPPALGEDHTVLLQASLPLPYALRGRCGGGGSVVPRPGLRFDAATERKVAQRIDTEKTLTALDGSKDESR